MSENRVTNFSESENTCVVCFRIVDAFSVGVCDHPVCFECSTRMRVLCSQLECPICRREMPAVIFTKDIQPFSILKPKIDSQNLFHEKYGIYFATSSLQRRYYRLLDHECFICRRNPNNVPFKTFQHLKDHMRRAHDLFYCDLCVLNLKIFTFERKCYTRVDLATHRRKGDTDNTSHKGHPLCEFCDTRFMDNDELFRHLRRDHLYCHFCDADGKHQYYNTYNDLRRHYLDEHYLCEEGDCKHERFTSVFRSDIDLKAHSASVHSRNLSRAANRQARTLEVEFTLAPRARQEVTSTRGGRNYGQRNVERQKAINSAASSDSYSVEPGGYDSGGIHEMQLFSNPLAAENFPSLGGDSNGSTVHTISNVTITSKLNPLSEENFPTLGNGSGSSKQSAVTITKAPAARGQQRLERNLANFPVLGESSGSGSVRLSVNGNKQEFPSSAKAPNVSIRVNHRGNGEVTTRINHSTSNDQTVPVRPKSTSSAFPALSDSHVQVSQPQWVQVKTKKQQEAKQSKVAPAPNLPPSSLNDFPTLSKSGKSDSKKMASSSVWVNLNSFNSNTVSKNHKPVAKSSKTIDLAQPSKNNNNKLDSNDDKLKNSKKKKAKTDAATTEGLSISMNKMKIGTSSEVEQEIKSNGITKKRAELNVEVGEPSVIIGYVNGITSTNHLSKPPPGFNLKPPPGLSNFTLSNNELVFTNSSGQSYQITAQQFFPPQNFKMRNQYLIERFKTVFHNANAIQEFKMQSDMFRTGEMKAEKYYEYCKSLMGREFETLFPELLALLPSIQRQQDLYTVHTSKRKANNLEVCATCYQVVLSGDLRNHLSNHVLDNHFPVLNNAINNNSAWNTK